MAIDLSKIIAITDRTLGSSVTGVTQAGMFLSLNEIIPFNGTNQQVIRFNDAATVGAFFGTASEEYQAAVKYFKNYDGAISLPPFIHFARYVNSAIAPYTRGGVLVASNLAALQAITTGTLTVNFNSTATNLVAIDLSGATSFSDVAAIVQVKLDIAIPAATVTYDSITDAFTISNNDTSGTSTVTYCLNGTLAAAMKLQQNNGAILSQGSPALSVSDNLDNIVAITKNWTPFTNLFDLPDAPDYSYQYDFARWTLANPKYLYVLWTLEENLTILNNTSNIAYGMIDEGLATLNADGSITYLANIMPNYGDVSLAAFSMGMGASINYTRTNATINFAGKSQVGLLPSATSNSEYDALTANGFNFYGQFNSSSASYNFTENGSIGGQFKFADNFFNQKWLSDNIQNRLAVLIQTISILPNNDTGYTYINDTVNGSMLLGLNNGVIQTGNVFSTSQTATLIQEAGYDITSQLTNSGYVIQVIPATPEERIARAPVLGNAWYTNGGAINKIGFTVTFVQ
jgi:hypothetical protein